MLALLAASERQGTVCIKRGAKLSVSSPEPSIQVSGHTCQSECRRIEHEQTTIQKAKETVGSSGRLLWTRITIGKRLRRYLLKGPNNFRDHLIRNNTSRSKVAQSRNSKRRRTELARLTKKTGRATRDTTQSSYVPPIDLSSGGGRKR